MRHTSNNSRVADPLELVKNDIAAVRRDMTALVGSRIGAAGDRTRETLHWAGGQAKALAQTSREKARAAHGRLRDAAAARPITTIALAAAAGAVAAGMASRLWRR